MDRFPNQPTRTIARVLYEEAPEMFVTVDMARSCVRFLRGASGADNRKKLKDKKYVRQSI